MRAHFIPAIMGGMTSAILLSTSSLLLAQITIPAELEPLREARISTRPAERMLVVEATGDPRTVGAAAFGLLFQLYYQIPETPKGPEQPAPRARWPSGLDLPRSEWKGLYALPVPDSVTALPEHTPPTGLKAKLTQWDYGEVTEVLHIGPYDREEPALRLLEQVAEDSGYRLDEEHEEEYIRGPTMSGPGDPEKYLTILRYRVVKPADEG